MPARDAHLRLWPKRIPRRLTPPATSVWRNLEIAAERYPDKAAFVFGGAALSYRDLRAGAEALAGWLQRAAGVAPGDRVIVDLQSSPAFAIAYYAVLRADAVVVPVSPMLLAAELRHFVGDSGARVAIAAQDLVERLLPAAGETGIERAVAAVYSAHLDPGSDAARVLPETYTEPARALADPRLTAWADAIGAGHAPRASVAGPDDLAVLPYTSGTTGRPKGCMHTHASVMANLVGAAVWSEMVADSVVLSTLPWFHVTGMQHCMSAPIYAGATTVVLPRWDRREAGRLVEAHRVTHWNNIPTMVIDFLGDPECRARDLTSLAFIGGGGAAMPEAVARRLEESSGLRYEEGYGLTETIAQTHMNPRDFPLRQCMGVPTFDVDARIVDPETLAELGDDETGEVIVSGPQVCRGYWGSPEATAAAFVEIEGRRYLRTGDLARRDAKGYFFLVDRLKRMINAGGYKVSPAEVESILYRHPDVQEACVIAAPDARLGETVKAVIVPTDAARDTLSAETIIAWAHGEMAAFKVPRVVELAESLPKSATGKVQWRLLQERERANAR